MTVTTTETKKAVKPTFNDEFENYLKKQQIKTQNFLSNSHLTD